MKNFKITKSILLALVLISGSFLTSCSSDDDEDAGIVGTWISTLEVDEDYENNVLVDTTNYTSDANNYNQITFKSDNTFTSISSETYEGKIITHSINGTYKIKGNEIITTIDEKVGTLKFSVNGNTLTTIFEDIDIYENVEYKYVTKTTYKRK